MAQIVIMMNQMALKTTKHIIIFTIIIMINCLDRLFAYNLVWSEDFDNTVLDSNIWNIEVNCDGLYLYNQLILFKYKFLPNRKLICYMR